MRKIENTKQLKEERIRLLQDKLNLEIEIEHDFRDLKNIFSPARLIPMGISNLVINKNHGLLNDSIGMLVSLITRKVMVRAGFITKLIVPFIAGNAASNFVEKKKEKIAEWITGLFNKTSENKKSSEYFYEDAIEDYD